MSGIFLLSFDGSYELTMDVSQLESSLSILEGRLESILEDPRAYDDVFPISAQCLYFHLVGQNYMRKYSIMHDCSISKRALEYLHEGIKLSIRQLDSADGKSLLENCRLHRASYSHV